MSTKEKIVSPRPTLDELRKHGDERVKALAHRLITYLENAGSARQDEAELAAPQTIEAYRAARGGLRSAEKKIYLLEQQLEAARRSNARMVEQVQAEQDRSTALSAELDEERSRHEVALALAQMAIDRANAKREELLKAYNTALDVIDKEPNTGLDDAKDPFLTLPEDSPFSDRAVVAEAESQRRHTVAAPDIDYDLDLFARSRHG